MVLGAHFFLLFPILALQIGFRDNMQPVPDLTTLELRTVLDVIHACQRVEVLNEFIDVLQNQLQQLIPYDKFSLGRMERGQAYSLLNINFPDDYITQVLSLTRTTQTPDVDIQQKKYQPLFYDESTISDEHPLWRETFLKYGLTNVANHSLIDVPQTTLVCFSIGDLVNPWDARQQYLLEVLMPYFYIVAQRLSLSSHPLSKPQYGLSLREKEVLKWAAMGKNNSEMGAILGVSDSTVKTYIDRAMRKLNVYNRTHAVAIAISQGLIQL